LVTGGAGAAARKYAKSTGHLPFSSKQREAIAPGGVSGFRPQRVKIGRPSQTSDQVVLQLRRKSDNTIENIKLTPEESAKVL
jgi:hypothetical protein